MWRGGDIRAGRKADEKPVKQEHVGHLLGTREHGGEGASGWKGGDQDGASEETRPAVQDLEGSRDSIKGPWGPRDRWMDNMGSSHMTQ